MTPKQVPRDSARHTDPLSGAEHTVSLLDASRALGLGRTMSYELVRAGRFPVPVIRAGGVYRVPLAPLRRLLDGEQAAS